MRRVKVHDIPSLPSLHTTAESVEMPASLSPLMPTQHPGESKLSWLPCVSNQSELKAGEPPWLPAEGVQLPELSGSFPCILCERSLHVLRWLKEMVWTTGRQCVQGPCRFPAEVVRDGSREVLVVLWSFLPHTERATWSLRTMSLDKTTWSLKAYKDLA